MMVQEGLKRQTHLIPPTHAALLWILQSRVCASLWQLAAHRLKQVEAGRGRNMRENQLRTLLSQGKPTLGTRVQSSWPTITELVGRSQQFDYVEFLADNAPYDLSALGTLGRP